MNQDIYLVTKKNFVSLVRLSDMYTPGPFYFVTICSSPKIETLSRVTRSI